MGLDVVELFMTVEGKYGIDIPDAEASVMRSVGDLHEYIVTHATPSPDPAEAWAWLQNMISEDFGVPLERITREAWVVRDLGIN